MSVRVSISSSAACSGLMYSGVPSIMPCSVNWVMPVSW